MSPLTGRDPEVREFIIDPVTKRWVLIIAAVLVGLGLAVGDGFHRPAPTATKIIIEGGRGISASRSR